MKFVIGKQMLLRDVFDDFDRENGGVHQFVGCSCAADNCYRELLSRGVQRH